MHIKQKVRWLLTGTLLTTGACLAEPTRITMGDGQVDGTGITPYAFTWHQCAKQDDAWMSLPALTETVRIENGHLIVQHDTARPDGGVTQSVITLDHKTLSPRETVTEIRASDGAVIARIHNTLTESGHETRMTQGENEQHKRGTITNQQYHGSILGLPLATLDFTDQSYTMPASMLAFEASYELMVTHAGQEQVTLKDQRVTVDWVDVKWTHNELGDVYPPGPNASGGRYWIVRQPPKGIPYVLRYQTDSYAVEFMREVCPNTDQAEDDSESGQ